MKEKVDVLEQKLHALESKENHERAGLILKLECKKCEKRFISEKDLRKNFRESHLGEVKCTMYSTKLTRYCNLEVHLENHHKTKKSFECNTTFILN